MKYLDFTDLFDAEPANLAVLSTYQLDPDFFERRLLRCSTLAKARRILVFLDARQWYNLLRQDTPARFLNRRYLVVPVHRSQGVFHPKLSLLLAEQGGQVLCGSNNLTRSGCSSNLELLNAFTFGAAGESEEAIRLAQADAHGTILAFLLAESQGHRMESDPVWVIQEHRLTYEPSGEGSSSAKQKVEETGEGLAELLEEIGRRDGVDAVIEYLERLTIGPAAGSGLAVGRKFRLRVHDPFHPDVAPEWLINFKNKAENLAKAIKDFVERHEKRRLQKYARYGHINNMENFLDIFTAMVRLLYMYYVRGLGMEKKYVTKNQLIGQLITFIEIATGGIDTETETRNGFLTAISDNLDDAKLLQEVSDTTNFAGNIKAALMITQKVRFIPSEQVQYGPAPNRPRECLPSLSRKVRGTFVAVGLTEPSRQDVHEALENYRMFTDKEITEFRNELASANTDHSFRYASIYPQEKQIHPAFVSRDADVSPSYTILNALAPLERINP